MKQILSAFLTALTDLFLPPACLGCSAPLSSSQSILLCPSCLSALQPITGPVCTCCGRPYGKAAPGDHHCGACLTGKRYFSTARALFLYEEPVKKIIHNFKYHGQRAGLASFRRFLQRMDRISGLAATAELILPVPLHKERLRERGFNQSLLLARAFYPKDNRIDPFLLRRPTATLPQTSFNGKARRKNLKNAFAVSDPGRVRGKRVLLVDDVFTTGTTVNECARTLKRAGAAEVMVLTLARVREE